MKNTAAILLTLVAAGAAMAHNHITVDTIATAKGPKIVIRAGYYASESGLSIQNGRLLSAGTPLEYAVPDQLTQSGPLSGWHAGDELLLTSDFYVASGRLNGGDFLWEIAGVVRLDGGPATSAAWGEFDLTGLVPQAFTTGQTRAERSYHVGLGGHEHAQGYGFAAPGLYDVTLIAWDTNGVYLDSEPLTVRFRVGAACYANCDGGSVAPTLNALDFSCFLAAFQNAQSLPAGEQVGAYANCDASTTAPALNALDFACFLNRYRAGCP